MAAPSFDFKSNQKRDHAGEIKNMSTLSVFELAQLEAEETVWVPTRATRFISRLLSRQFKKMDGATTMERHRHKRQPKPATVRMITQLRPASRRRYTSNECALSPKAVTSKKMPKARRPAAANMKPATNKQ